MTESMTDPKQAKDASLKVCWAAQLLVYACTAQQGIQLPGPYIIDFMITIYVYTNRGITMHCRSSHWGGLGSQRRRRQRSSS